MPTAEDEWIQKCQQCENSDIQQKLVTETPPPLEALNVALIDEKRITSHKKMTKNFKSNEFSSKKPFNHFIARKEPTLNIERSTNCMKSGGTFSKGHLVVCPPKDTTCTYCKFCGLFTRL